MSVYLLGVDVENYRNLTLAGKLAEDYRAWDRFEFDGRSLPADVELPPIEPMGGDLNEGLPLGDTAHLAAGVAVFSEKAILALGDLLRPHGQVLPLKCKEGKFYAFNVTRVLDGLDLEKSSIERFPSSGRVMQVYRYVFKTDVIGGYPIFKIKYGPNSDLLRGELFVSDEFVDRVKATGLTGFRFEKLA